MSATAQTSSGSASELSLRRPRVADGAAIWALVRESGVLEPNTCYAYLLLSTHFAGTCVVAERDGELVGFALGYRPPTRPEAVFVWQIGVRADARGAGLGKRLLHQLVELPDAADATFLEATVGTSNQASARLFLGFARERGVACERAPGFESADFGPLEHEPEPLYRIGPLRKQTTP
ncbi:L-2,4-diaminobutyric acid acetyltransferase [Enhygromyxa salina]|uniref:L-2,4-diaminobutyric acid acetyltransferase n=1 Tax=Enhygromyxa salina TaxID=215803 RepID=A0A2S9YD28_9BACT|nr:diaminobutyrate acetyltransferase [Enhygromyxa salina]PRQ03005.1 L-2,4-diaminobutyric acid acetyltransferase [Enhygromyxa salina]